MKNPEAKSARRNARSAPPSGSERPSLDDKLLSVRYCIASEHDEDALAHLFDLVSALRVRAAVRGVSEKGLTPDGHRMLAMLVPNADVSDRRDST